MIEGRLVPWIYTTHVGGDLDGKAGGRAMVRSAKKKSMLEAKNVNDVLS